MYLNMRKKLTPFTLIFLLLLINACATYHPQYADSDFPTAIPQKTIETTFYLVGDAGNAPLEGTTIGLQVAKDIMSREDTTDDYLLYLGDNIYNKGMPTKEAPDRRLSEHRIDAQIAAANEFKGQKIFIPGNHDWYHDGLKGLKRQEKYIRKHLDHKHAFLPSKGCPIKSIEVTPNVQMIIIDTQWYLVDWDKHPTINDDCLIKTRAAFLTELQGELKKHNEKTILLAMHHPMFTNGIHGGKTHIKRHLFPKKKVPLPILGSLATVMRSQGGVSAQDRYNKRNNELMQRIATMAHDNDRIIFASGHEHSLQFIDHDGLKQIISGSGAKETAASLGNDGLFAYPRQGMAVLDIYTDGSSNVRFYGRENGNTALVYQTAVHPAPSTYSTSQLPTSFATEKTATIYDKSETEKSNFFKFLWGAHYRDVYSTPIRVPVATLDTLMGGFTIERQGGGQVTRSLRLIDKDGKRYSLRAMRKSVTQFLQKGAFQNTYLGDSFDGTYTETLLADFYTSSYPYAFLAVGGLADAIGVYHANPQVLYMPKHPALGNYNATFGDALYFLEERPGKEHKDVASFGNPDDIEGTDDVIKKLRKDEKYTVDEPHYIRTRLFDMLLGDWDRHEDQWRWARFDKEGTSTYRPIPKDRDQVFCNYDGNLLGAIKLIAPATRKFGAYSGRQKNIRWINEAGIRLDRTFAQQSGKEVWIAEAAYIKEKLTDEVIEQAFTNLPNELQGTTVAAIKASVRSRRDAIETIAAKYYDYLSKLVIMRGTDKDDFFEIERQERQTKISIARIKGGEVKKPFIERTVLSNETNEIWIYGLDDDDQFVVKGNGKCPIRIRIIGGQNNDVYTIENGKKVKVYDHATKPNTIQKAGNANFVLSNHYNYNTYDPKKNKNTTNTITPLIGFNPDDGINVNLTDTYVVKGFTNAPYQSKHIVSAAYYLATQGYDLSYKGEFARVLGNWNLQLSGMYTSNNFTQNFFGLGNETENLDDDLGLDFNRVKTSIWQVTGGIVKRGQYGSILSVIAGYEGIEVANTTDRLISTIPVNDPSFFDRKFFAGLDLKYTYQNSDVPANPTRGMLFSLEGGAKMNTEETDRTFGYIHPTLGFYNAITRNRKLVLKTLLQAQFMIGDTFEFYQAASLGGNKGLRGYREERFTGERALAFSTDLRYSFPRIKTSVLPVQLGVYSGFDVGRVWVDQEGSTTWHDSIGGGMWINAVDAISGQLGVFNSDDGIRLTVGFGLNL